MKFPDASEFRPSLRNGPSRPPLSEPAMAFSNAKLSKLLHITLPPIILEKMKWALGQEFEVGFALMKGVAFVSIRRANSGARKARKLISPGPGSKSARIAVGASLVADLGAVSAKDCPEYEKRGDTLLLRAPDVLTDHIAVMGGFKTVDEVLKARKATGLHDAREAEAHA